MFSDIFNFSFLIVHRGDALEDRTLEMSTYYKEVHY